MKILKMIGLVVAVHVVVLTFGFILPGCQSTARSSGASGRPADPNLSRIDAARAASNPAQTGQEDAPAVLPQTTQHTPPPSGSPFVGGPVTDFSAPPPAIAAPVRPEAAADSPALAPEADAQPAALTYTVVSGDNPWTIARKFKVPHKELLAANNLTARSTLQIGQKLKIPAKTVSGKTAVAQPGTTVYTVQPNDSLGSIARRHRVSVEQIQSINKLSGATIRIGQALVIPASTVTPVQDDTRAPAPAAATTSAPKGVSVTHIVKPGETLGGIAAYYGASSNEIGVANHITNPNFLQAGQKLVINARKNIPAGTPANAAEPAPAPAAAQPAPASPAAPAPAPASTSPISPISPVIDSPVMPAADTPPVNTPQDPYTPPFVVPQN